MAQTILGGKGQAEKKASKALAKAKNADPEKMALKELELEQVSRALEVWCSGKNEYGVAYITQCCVGESPTLDGFRGQSSAKSSIAVLQSARGVTHDGHAALPTLLPLVDLCGSRPSSPTVSPQ